MCGEGCRSVCVWWEERCRSIIQFYAHVNCVHFVCLLLKKDCKLVCMALGAKEAHRTSLTQMLLKCCYLCGEHPLIWLYITSVVTMVLCLLGTQLHNSLITAAFQRV